jgi:hypothetical protein
MQRFLADFPEGRRLAQTLPHLDSGLLLERILVG